VIAAAALLLGVKLATGPTDGSGLGDAAR